MANRQAEWIVWTSALGICAHELEMNGPDGKLAEGFINEAESILDFLAEMAGLEEE